MNEVFLLESNNKESTQGHRVDLEECDIFTHREYVICVVVCFLVLLLQRTTTSQNEKNKS